jgi:pyruvate dehydrogenase E2 component (dihydrolipoamide acetyltransferase)
MPIDITMPRLSDSMEEGVVARWLVAPGTAVERGQPIAEIDTDKATMELEAEAAGTISEILVREGEAAPVGAPLARLTPTGEVLASPAPSAPPAAPPSPSIPPAVSAPSFAQPRGGVSPVARRLAAELGVDLRTVSGSGPGGIVTKEDVERAAEAMSLQAEPASLRGEVRIEQPSRAQRVIARRMSEARAIPDFAVEAELDMTAVVSWRESRTGAAGPAPSINDFLVKAAALALREFPRLNASYSERGFELYSRINIGIAVAGEDSLVVPTIFDADRKTLAEIAAESRRLAERVRSGSVAPSELEGGTFTITNLGMYGAIRFLPIINPPQAAILAAGAVTRRPVLDEHDAVVARWSMSAVLVCDHRIVYGADAARFLARLGELLERPETIA